MRREIDLNIGMEHVNIMTELKNKIQNLMNLCLNSLKEQV